MTKKTAVLPLNSDGLKKVWINGVYPEIDAGQFPIKRIVNDTVIVSADIFCDGIDEITAVLFYRHESELEWHTVPFVHIDNDRWQAAFKVMQIGTYHYTLQAWINDFATWKKRFIKKLELNDDVEMEKRIGCELLRKAYLTKGEEIIEKLLSLQKPVQILKLLANKELTNWMAQQCHSDYITVYSPQLCVMVDTPKAQFSAWYELFPRSMGSAGHGTFLDVINVLPMIKKMGFDVLYFPPIHPIGTTNRKGKNNGNFAQEKDPGSPWAIGGKEGGHTALHPELGTFEDFRNLIKKAKQYGIDIALDFAIQCSPNHPYIKEHPEWFKHRPDGSLFYAENPPKKYQDIYPIDFSAKSWPELWLELKEVVLFWIKEGINLFRVDNPHTKPFTFWQWLIKEIKKEHPQVFFLAEAFTRPKVMYHLAKCGFSQSYTYFTWRNTKEELTTYMQELNTQPIVDYYRPNFWVNTPDILTEMLQKGGRPAFIIRFILAATLSSNYGIYGPAYENCIGVPLHEGSEEYLNSEKYQLIGWTQSSDHIIDIISLVNQIRRQHPALHNNFSLNFYDTDNGAVICYSKHLASSNDFIIVVVNLDYENPQSAFINLSTAEIKSEYFLVHDLLTNETYKWQKGRCYVALDPSIAQCAHIFHVKEQDV